MLCYCVLSGFIFSDSVIYVKLINCIELIFSSMTMFRLMNFHYHIGVIETFQLDFFVFPRHPNGAKMFCFQYKCLSTQLLFLYSALSHAYKFPFTIISYIFSMVRNFNYIQTERKNFTEINTGFNDNLIVCCCLHSSR